MPEIETSVVLKTETDERSAKKARSRIESILKKPFPINILSKYREESEKGAGAGGAGLWKEMGLPIRGMAPYLRFGRQGMHGGLSGINVLGTLAEMGTFMTLASGKTGRGKEGGILGELVGLFKEEKVVAKELYSATQSWKDKEKGGVPSPPVLPKQALGSGKSFMGEMLGKKAGKSAIGAGLPGAEKVAATEIGKNAGLLASLTGEGGLLAGASGAAVATGIGALIAIGVGLLMVTKKIYDIIMKFVMESSGVQYTIQYIKTIIDTVVGGTLMIISMGITTALPFLKKIKDVSDTLKEFDLSNVSAAFSGNLDNARKNWNDFRTDLSNGFNELGNAWDTVYDEVILPKITDLRNKFDNFFKDVLSFFSRVITGIHGRLLGPDSLVSKFKEGVIVATGNIRETMSMKFSELKTNITTAFDGIKTAWGDLDIKGKMDSAFSNISTFFTETIPNILGGAFSKMWEVITLKIPNIAIGIWNTLAEKVNEISHGTINLPTYEYVEPGSVSDTGSEESTRSQSRRESREKHDVEIKTGLGSLSYDYPDWVPG